MSVAAVRDAPRDLRLFMDVRCEKCSTEYELEDQQVTAEGLSVKCSQCGFIFKVYLDDKPRAVWTVRQTDGNLLEFRELTTLQRWIVERKVARDDAISKTGKNWKRLGDIAELSAFFRVVEQASAPKAPLPAYQPPASLGSFSAASPGARSPAPSGAWTTGGSSGTISNTFDLSELDPPPNAAFIVGAGDVPAGHLTLPPSAQRPASGRPASRRVSQGPPPAPPDVAGLGEAHPAGAPAPRRGRGGLVLVVLLLLAGAGAGLYLTRPELITGLFAAEVPELALSHVRSGYTELDKDSSTAIDLAIGNFEKAMALAPDYPPAKAGLAEALLTRAEVRAGEVRRLELANAPQADGEETKRRVEELRASSNADAERAFDVGKQALVLDPTGLAANRAMAEYYRLKRADEQMQPLLERARTAGPSDPRVALLVGSTMLGDPAMLDRAIRYFDQALEGAPGLQRARYKLALAYQKREDVEQALLHTKAILEAVPDHERAKALLAALQPPAPEPVAEPAPAPEETKEPAMSFDRLLAQADRLRDRDQAQKAMRLYEQALELEPEDPDALAGMAWCYFDTENIDAAIMTFKQVLAKLPRFSDAHLGLAAAYEEKDMKRDAVKHYQKYLELLPDGPEAPVARAALERLQ